MNQLCGFTTIHIPNVEYTPGFSFKVQKKNKIMKRKYVAHTNRVLVSVCVHFWDGILQSVYIQYNESQDILNQAKEQFYTSADRPPAKHRNVKTK